MKWTSEEDSRSSHGETGSYGFYVKNEHGFRDAVVDRKGDGPPSSLRLAPIVPRVVPRPREFHSALGGENARENLWRDAETDAMKVFWERFVPERRKVK